ncbi:hypothetical protein RUM43_004902 [Polyplax serrata]|uniref:Oxidoreductase-like domain-containing protein n=1 Tax=Polyplax serrata TaxID=468196 RepID=A0AAN8SBG4_POLSC
MVMKLPCRPFGNTINTTFKEQCNHFKILFGKGLEHKKNLPTRYFGSLKLPEEPQNCCMSGCANCVWVAYAEEVAKILNDGGETAKKKIMEHVKDPNLRAFLMLELNHLFKKEK